jgi:hypothetical protein
MILFARIGEPRKRENLSRSVNCRIFGACECVVISSRDHNRNSAPVWRRGWRSLIKVGRPAAVVLIAVVNLVIYVAVLAWVLSFLITDLPYFGDAFFWAMEGFYLLLGVVYSIAGMIGIVYLLKSWKSFRWTAMIGYAFELVLFSIIGYFWGWSLGSDGYNVSFRIYHYQFIFGAAAVIVFKIASIVYLARKKT